MLKVQGPIIYTEGSDSLDGIHLELEIKFPIYEYESSDGSIVRQLLNHKTFKKSLLTPIDEFEKIIPIQDIVAYNIEAIGNFISYIFRNINQLNENSPIQSPFEFNFLLKDKLGNDLSTQNHKSLFGFDINSNENIGDNQNDSNLEKYFQSLSKLFLINKEVFDLLVNQITTQFPAFAQYNMQKYIFLYICQLADIRSGILTLTVLSDAQRQKLIDDLNNIDAITEGEQILNIIESFFDSLGEFPLQIPELKSIEIKGKIEIISDSDREIEKSDFEFYDIVTVVEREGKPSFSFNYNWDVNEGEPEGNVIPIVLAEPNSLTLNDSINFIAVKVRGFDGTVLWKKKYYPNDEALQNLEISIEEYSPNILNSNDLRAKDIDKKLRGKVLQYGEKYDLNELTIVVQTRADTDEMWKISSAGKTDKSGNFSLDYPYGEYTEAQVLVSLMPNSPASIAIVNNPEKINETVSDDFIYLLLIDENVEEDNTEETNGVYEEHCDCDAPIKAKRLPDQADLIESSEYTQDMGGTCLNLSTPNRTLKEYSYNALVRITDPDVSKYTLIKSELGEKTTFRLEGGDNKIERGSVDLNNPILWQDAPEAESDLSIYQTVTIATGHILHYKSVFKADGYSLGDLVYSLPLAPGQKKQIVVFESSHSLSGAESQTISQGESLSADLISERFITDQLSGGINEDLSGRSTASTSGISGGLGVGGSYGGIGGSLGVAGGTSKSKSSASQNSSRNISQFFGEKLRQSVMQNAESYRQLNASVVTTVTEGQEYGVTSEVIANHNHCHSLTMMYFEVLRHYAIFQELSHVEECVFVPLLMTNFSTENIHKWKDILARNLLPIHSNTYLQPFPYLLKGRRHPLLKAFDANERVKTNWSRVEFPSERFADDDITKISGEFTLRVELKRPKTRYDRIFSFPVISTIIEHRELDKAATAKAMFNPFDWSKKKYRTIEEEVFEKAQIFDKFMSLDQDFEHKKPVDAIRVMNFNEVTTETIDIEGDPINITVSGSDFFDGDVVNKNLWETYSLILGHRDVYEMLNTYFRGSLISEWNGIFNNQMLPEIFKNILDSIKIDSLNWDLNNVIDYKGGEKKIKIRITNGGFSSSRSSLPEDLKIFCNSEVVKRLEGGFARLDIENIRIEYATNFFQGILFNSYIGDDIFDETTINIPLTARDKVNPKKEDAYLVNELIEHLNSNLEHYNKVLWLNLDPDRRYLLLDGFSIEIYNSFGRSIGARSLASVVKNELITITGNSLVFPVADGYKVSQSYILEDIGEGVQQEVSLFDHYKPLKPIPPYRISVPTRGVYMEAIKGSCDACEMVKENSSQDWDKFRTEEPTPISPVVTPTPTITEYKPEYKDFAAPMVNIQNAPDAPAPAAGLSQLSELLGKAGVFNDITGLAGNQENAIKTYLSNQENAKAFAEMAKSMATQQHNTTNRESISDGIERARRAGTIDDTDARNLTRQHIQQQIDGGESDRENAQFEREQNRPSLTSGAINAINRGQPVQAERIDPDGTSESVDIGMAGTDSDAERIMYQIEALQQPSSNSCWAAAATMMMNWKNSRSEQIENVLSDAGNNLEPANESYYTTMFTENRVLPANEKDQFITALGMIGEAPANYLLSQYMEWLIKYGPLWVTTDANPGEGFSPHAKILYGIEENQLYFINPANGNREQQTFDEFKNGFEQMVTDNVGPLYLQIVHFRENIANNSGEGHGEEDVSQEILPLFQRDYEVFRERVIRANTTNGGRSICWRMICGSDGGQYANQLSDLGGLRRIFNYLMQSGVSEDSPVRIFFNLVRDSYGYVRLIDYLAPDILSEFPEVNVEVELDPFAKYTQFCDEFLDFVDALRSAVVPIPSYDVPTEVRRNMIQDINCVIDLIERLGCDSAYQLEFIPNSFILKFFVESGAWRRRYASQGSWPPGIEAIKFSEGLYDAWKDSSTDVLTRILEDYWENMDRGLRIIVQKQQGSAAPGYEFDSYHHNLFDWFRSELSNINSVYYCFRERFFSE